MADKPKMTQDVDLGPGLVLTPDHEHQPRERPHGVVHSDRRVFHDGSAEELPILSTYGLSESEREKAEAGKPVDAESTGQGERPAARR